MLRYSYSNFACENLTDQGYQHIAIFDVSIQLTSNFHNTTVAASSDTWSQSTYTI